MARSLLCLVVIAGVAFEAFVFQIFSALAITGIAWLQRKKWNLFDFFVCFVLSVPLIYFSALKQISKPKSYRPEWSSFESFHSRKNHVSQKTITQCLAILDQPETGLRLDKGMSLFDEDNPLDYVSYSLVSLDLNPLAWKGSYFSGDFGLITPETPTIKYIDGRLFIIYLEPLPSPSEVRGYLGIEIMIASEHEADRTSSWLVANQKTFLHSKPVVVDHAYATNLKSLAATLNIPPPPFEMIFLPDTLSHQEIDILFFVWSIFLVTSLFLSTHQLGDLLKMKLALFGLTILIIPTVETRDHLSMFASHIFGSKSMGGLFINPFRFLMSVACMLLLLQSLWSHLKANKIWSLLSGPLLIWLAFLVPTYIQSSFSLSLIHPIDALNTPGSAAVFLGFLLCLGSVVLLIDHTSREIKSIPTLLVVLCAGSFLDKPYAWLSVGSFLFLWLLKDLKMSLPLRSALAVLCFYPSLFLIEQKNEIDYLKNDVVDEITLIEERNYFRMGRIIQRLDKLEVDLKSPHEHILDIFVRKCGLLEDEVDFALSIVGPDNQVVSEINHHLAFERLPLITFPLDRIDSVLTNDGGAKWMVFRTTLETHEGPYDFSVVLGNDHQGLSLIRGPRRLQTGDDITNKKFPYFSYVFEVFDPDGRRIYGQGSTDSTPFGEKNKLRLQSESVFWTREGRNTIFYIADQGTMYRITHKATPINMILARFLLYWLSVSSFSAVIRLSQRPGRNILAIWNRSFALKLATFLFLASGVPVITLGYVLISSIQNNQTREELAFAQARMLAATNLFRGVESDAMLVEHDNNVQRYREIPLPLYARILGEDLSLYAGGRLVNSNQPEMYRSGHMNRRLPMSLAYELLVEKAAFRLEASSATDLRPAVAYASVPLGGEREGILAMTIIPFSQRQKMRLYEQLEFSLSILLTLVFFMALFARFLSKSILRPVSAITRAAARMAKGLSNRPIQIHRQDELERMVVAFNTMQERVVGSQTALRQQLYLLDATLGSMSSGVLGFSQNGQILLDNAITWKLLQLNQACGELKELVQNETLAVLGPAFDSGRNTEMNLMLHREGETRQILVKLRFVKVTRDLDVYCIMAFEDITSALAASRFKAWAEMARRIAHEIKNPLTPIQLEMDHLNRIYKDQSPHFGEALTEASNEIRLQVNHLKRIATEFSDYARPMELQHEPTDLTQLVQSLIDPYERTLNGLKLERDLAPELIAEVDPRLIRRAFHNLILNAIQAMNEEGTLRIKLSAEGDHATCLIEDTGPGIPVEEHDRVFEAYFSTKDHGSGLGLVIARKYITSHGGTLAIDGQYLHGTRFTVTLPLTAQMTSNHNEL